MTSDRFQKIGIQRELCIEWFEQAARIYGAGYSKSEARKEIYLYLDDAPGFSTPPSLQTKTYIANALIKSWVSPEKDLSHLRGTAYKILQETSIPLVAHWSVLGAAYPFWFEVASKIGRLLNLQEQVTQGQIVSRLKETYGDRQTVSRRARYVIRSFVNWGILKDTKVKGCYEKVKPITILDHNLAILLIESILLAHPEGKGILGVLLNNPAFFPFKIRPMTGEFISQHSNRIDVDRYGLDDELLAIKGKSGPL